MKAIIGRVRRLEDAFAPEIREPVTIEIDYVDITGAVVSTESVQVPGGPQPISAGAS